MTEKKNKICSKCKIGKFLSEFPRHKGYREKLYCWCRSCINEYCREYYQKHKKYHNQYYLEHRKKHNKQMKNWREKNKEKIKEYILNNKGKRNKYLKERRKKNINFKLICCLRNRINEALKNNYKKSSTIILLDCTIQELRKHLEKQFKKGMNWNNWGRKGWHIDHIKPCMYFDLAKVEEQRKCFHYTNLQPLWARENLRKPKKYIK